VTLGHLYTWGNHTKVNHMKDKSISKTIPIAAKVSQDHIDALDKLVADGKAKTRSAAIQYLISQHIILGGK